VTRITNRAQVYRIFSAAMDVDPAQREALVREECQGDMALIAEVTALLGEVAHDTNAMGLLPGAQALPAADLSGQEYGRFRLQELIGKGGMGVVYRAVRTDGVPQSVAMKLLRGVIQDSTSSRFVREARILARLDHPAIARLIDVGVRNGEAWIALELVRGRPIDEYCDQHDLDTRQRVQLLALIADAVATAHRSLVVHRDIKPTNVLVGADGRPKLIDFGIAFALQGADGGRESTTEVRRHFTCNYAAPEQAMGDPASVAIDVFGLGALAHRLLCGKPIFAQATSPLNYLLAVTQQDVPTPSRTAAAAGMNKRRVADLRGDLDAVVLKALDRDPAHRYATVQEFQADLHRYLEGLPVSAHAATLGYRLAKFVRRRALPVSFAALFLLVVISGAVVYGLKERAVIRAQNFAAQRGAFLESLLKSADPSSGEQESTVAALLDAAAGSVGQKFADEPLVEASMLNTIARTNVGLGRFDAGLAANDRQLALLRDHGGSTQVLGEAWSLRGLIYQNLGRWPESEAAARQAVALLQPLQVPGPLCDALDNLAVALIFLFREPEAETVLRQEIAIETRGGAALQHRLMIADNTYSVMLGNDLGRYAEAARYGLAAYDIARKTLPLDHTDRVGAEQTYAGTLVNTHRAHDAEPLFRDVVARRTRLLGAAHHDTLVGQLGLAENLIELNRNSEAADIALPAAKLFESQFGPDNNFTLLALNYYGVAACQSHHEAAGLTAMQRVAAARERLLPGTNRWLYIARIGVGMCLMSLKRYAEAEATLLAAAHGLEAVRGPHFHWTQVAFQALRDLYVATQRPGDAAIWAGKLID
jgi:eukaryotic-like serine/threonine-protein kinase